LAYRPIEKGSNNIQCKENYGIYSFEQIADIFLKKILEIFWLIIIGKDVINSLELLGLKQ
jgi:hypothetical protein